MKPTVTALIALYNNEDYIGEALDSVLNQTYENVQIAIIDDASTDRSASIVLDRFTKTETSVKDKYMLHDGFIDNRRIALLKLFSNGRQGRARNFGIKHFWDSTDIFALCDSDDIQLPHKFSSLAAKIQEAPDTVGLAYGDYFIKNNTNGTLLYEYKAPYSMQHLMNECIIHSNCLFSKRAIEKVGPFFEDESPVEDYGLFLRIAHHFMCVHVAEALTTVNVHGKNSSTVYGTDHHKEQFQRMINNYQGWLKSQ
jgi:glycosyltransferase involved in cell wall biosynthesis